VTDRDTPPEAHAPTAGLSALLAELAASDAVASLLGEWAGAYADAPLLSDARAAAARL